MSEPSKIVVELGPRTLGALAAIAMAMQAFGEAAKGVTVDLTNDRAEQDEEVHRKAQETVNLTADRDAFRCVHCNQLRSEHVGANFICRNQQISLNPFTYESKEP